MYLAGPTAVTLPGSMWALWHGGCTWLHGKTAPSWVIGTMATMACFRDFTRLTQTNIALFCKYALMDESILMLLVPIVQGQA